MKTTAKTVPVTIGLDIAKNFFQVHWVDAAAKSCCAASLAVARCSASSRRSLGPVSA
jgi:hypothetical protein